MKNKRTEITVESYEVLVMSRRGSLRLSWCPSCRKNVAIISLDDACMSGLSIEAIRRHAETGRIHLIDTVGGSSLICINSLIQI